MDDAVLQHLSKEELLAWIRCQRKCSRMTYPEHDALSEFLQESGLFTSLPFTVFVRPLRLEQPFDWISDYSVHLAGFPSHRFRREPAFWLSRIHPQDKQRVVSTLATMRVAQVIELEYRFLSANEHWINVFDRSVGISSKSAGGLADKSVGALLDVTQRRALEKQVSEISEEEKQKLGRDLHDDLCQQLTCVELLVHSMQRRIHQTGRLEPSKLDDLLHHLRQAIVTTQTMARGLSTATLGDLGLRAALDHWLSNLDTVLPLRIRFKGPKRLHLRDPHAAVHIYRIAQEAVQNAIKHSGASEIRVHLKASGDNLTLKVADNGSRAGDIHSKQGLGMKTMHYRSSLLHATLRIDQNSHGGLDVLCEIPFIVESDHLDH